MTLIWFYNNILEVLPGYPGAANGPARTLSNYELKFALFEALPQSYQKTFRLAGFKLSVESLADMEAYFEDQYMLDPAVAGQQSNNRGREQRTLNRVTIGGRPPFLSK